MVGSLLHPLNIFILGLGGGFLIPLLNRLGKTWVVAGFIAALAAMTLISAFCAVRLFYGAEPIEILTGGSTPPYSINLRMGLAEAFAATSVNLIGLLGAFYFVREKYAVMLLYLVIVMGIQGMVMTRDMFNLFVFLEIVSIATYGLLSLGSTTAALSAAFKFLMATIVASTLFLLGTMLLYAVTGMLNIDDLIANRATIEGPVGFAALMLLLACLLLELKPFPANGWGLDVYETAPSSVASLIATGVSAGVFFALYNLFPLFENHAEVIAILGARDLRRLQPDRPRANQGAASARLFLCRADGTCVHGSGAPASIRCRSGDPFGRRRTVRQSPSRQGRVVLACGICRQGEH